MQKNETETGNGRPPLLILHHRTTSLPFSPEDLSSCKEEIRTASYAPETLRDILQQPYDIAVVYLDAHVVEAAAFVREAALLKPRMKWLVLTDIQSPGPGAEALFMQASRVLGGGTPLKEVCAAAAQLRETIRPPDRPGGIHPRLRSLLADLPRAIQGAVRSSTIVSAVRELGAGLGRVLPHDVVGVLGLGEENVFYVAASRPVSQRLVDALEREMTGRFWAISGRRLDREYLRREIGQLQFQAEAPRSFSRSLSLPVFVENETAGILAVADIEGDGEIEPPDAQLLAVAADHVGIVLGAVRGVRSLATRDPLTGALNRKGMEDALERTWIMGRRHGFQVAVIVVDIDKFKTLNDSYGHDVGDQVLVEFVEVFRSVARGSDLIARYGGDEFVAILSQADERAARSLGERLIASVRNHVFCKETRNLPITVSIGLSTSQAPVPPMTSADLFSQADRALYVAKREGRNRLCVWPESVVALEQSAGSRERVSDVGPQQAQAGMGNTLAGKIMVVDDQPAVRSVVGDLLRRAAYDVDCFDSADGAIEAMKKADRYDYGVMLTDLNMPGKSGIQLLQEMAAVNDTVVKIVMTGYATVSNAVSSLREGAYDFVQKPVHAAQLHAVISRAMEYRRLRLENARYNENLEELVRERSGQLAAMLEEVRRSHEFTLEALVAMLDAREDQTARHSVRVRRVAVALGERAGLSDDVLKTLSQAALLHDIGKISVSDAILLKPGPLLPEEWEVMRRHPEAGYRILKSGAYLRDVAEMVLSHHEWYDGTGYPRGLKGKGICVGARVFGVADAYEAMRSERVYRQALDPETTAAELVKGRGTQFDPEIVDIVLKYQPEFERILLNA